MSKAIRSLALVLVQAHVCKTPWVYAWVPSGDVNATAVVQSRSNYTLVSIEIYCFFFLSGHVCTQLYGLYCLGGRASIAIGTWLKMQFPSCFCYSSPRHTGRFRRWYLVYKGNKRSFDIHGLYIFDCNLGLPSADSVTSHLPQLFNVMLATRTLGGSYHCYYLTLFFFIVAAVSAFVLLVVNRFLNVVVTTIWLTMQSLFLSVVVTIIRKLGSRSFKQKKKQNTYNNNHGSRHVSYG